MVEVELKDVQRLLLKYKRFDGVTLLNQAIGPHATQMLLRLERYPAPRPGQRYVRTGTLKRGWAMRRGQHGMISITNAVPYAQYVQGQRQAWMHRGRWTTTQALLQEYRPRIQRSVEKNLQAYIKS